MHRSLCIYCVLLPALLTACTTPDAAPPAVSISAPAVGQPVSGTVQVQVTASDESGVTRVGLYVRGRGSSGDGVFVGSASSEPFVISWFTPGFPNDAEVELVAEAEDATGNRRRSDPVWVKTANGGATVPNLSYLVAYTLPRPTAPAALGSAVPGGLLPDPQAVRPPVGPAPSARASGPAIPRTSARPFAPAQAEPLRSRVLEWAWQPVSAAAGYRIWLSSTDVAGPYLKVFDQLATSGTQKHSRTVEAKTGERFWGSVTAVVGSVEGAYSNADDASFLAPQELDAPADGAGVSDGRPTLAWKATPGAVGYLWFVSRKPQESATPADWVCTNSPNSTAELSVNYPSRCPTLARGTYYWWVAGVSFNQQGIADAFSFSDSRRLVVP